VRKTGAEPLRPPNFGGRSRPASRGNIPAGAAPLPPLPIQTPAGADPLRSAPLHSRGSPTKHTVSAPPRRHPLRPRCSSASTTHLSAPPRQLLPRRPLPVPQHRTIRFFGVGMVAGRSSSELTTAWRWPTQWTFGVARRSTWTARNCPELRRPMDHGFFYTTETAIYTAVTVNTAATR
jgi:hypothetical protein